MPWWGILGVRFLIDPGVAAGVRHIPQNATSHPEPRGQTAGCCERRAFAGAGQILGASPCDSRSSGSCDISFSPTHGMTSVGARSDRDGRQSCEHRRRLVSAVAAFRTRVLPFALFPKRFHSTTGFLLLFLATSIKGCVSATRRVLFWTAIRKNPYVCIWIYVDSWCTSVCLVRPAAHPSARAPSIVIPTAISSAITSDSSKVAWRASMAPPLRMAATVLLAISHFCRGGGGQCRSGVAHWCRAFGGIRRS